MFLKFDSILKNQQNLKNRLNLMFLMYHLFLMFDLILKNPQNLMNHLNLMFLMFHSFLKNLPSLNFLKNPMFH